MKKFISFLVWTFIGLTEATTECDCGISMMNRVVFGEDAQKGQYPWMVGVEIRTRSLNIYCGGSIIGPRSILTTAHCLFKNGTSERFSPSNTWILVGKHHIGKGISYPVKSFAYPRNYNPKYPTEEDIAIITMKSPLSFDENAFPICIGAYKDESSFSKLFVAGWGEYYPKHEDHFDRREGHAYYPEVLQHAKVDFINREYSIFD